MDYSFCFISLESALQTYFTCTQIIQIATVCCLMVTAAEEDLPQAGENRESKQFAFAPQFYPAPQSQYYYPESSPYGNPFMSPTEGAFLSQKSTVPSWPWSYPSPYPSYPSLLPLGKGLN